MGIIHSKHSVDMLIASNARMFVGDVQYETNGRPFKPYDITLIASNAWMFVGDVQYETEEQEQNMTDVKLKNEKDRIDQGRLALVACW